MSCNLRARGGSGCVHEIDAARWGGVAGCSPHPQDVTGVCGPEQRVELSDQ